MISKKNIKFLNRKESVFLFVLITPIFILLAIPAAFVFLFRGIFKVVTPVQEDEQTRRQEPYF
jgi:hypothetical protein